jgi:NSS family neurotransmitter:Na+ symporter
METVVSIVHDKLHINRRTCCFIVLGISVLLGVPSSLGYSAWSGVTVIGMQLLDFFDFISNNIIMPIVAFLTCLFVGYFIKPKTLIEEAEINNKFKLKGLFSVVIKFVAPVFIIVILVSSVLNVLGIIKI